MCRSQAHKKCAMKKETNKDCRVKKFLMEEKNLATYMAVSEDW